MYTSGGNQIIGMEVQLIVTAWKKLNKLVEQFVWTSQTMAIELWVKNTFQKENKAMPQMPQQVTE